MKNWKIVIEYKGKTLSIELEARSYADAYIEVELKYPGCVIKSISEVRN
jgi:hypothetical protein